MADALAVTLLLFAAAIALGLACRPEAARRLWLGGAAAAVLVALGICWLDLGAQRVAERMILPPGGCWLLLLAVVAGCWRPGARGLAILAGAAWLAWGVAGSPWVGARLVLALEQAVPAADPAATAEAICVLGGGTAVDVDNRPLLGSAGDRLSAGYLAWKAGRAPLLVASSSALFGDGGRRDLSAETAAIWTAWGVPAEAIVRLPEPLNTAQEIAAITALARERGWKRVILATSAWHLPRALALAQRAGLDAIPLPADRRGGAPPLHPAFLPPQSEGFSLVQIAVRERIGRLVGR
jgi:uncharacterized SAM-binding protein YcdF (DUF218 family)